jgi:uncharacterized protein
MRRIGLISDTHSFLDDKVFDHFSKCNEIWHAGDFGSIAISDELKERSGLPVKGVYGNIDGYDVRSIYPEKLSWKCEDVGVYMTHIGGYPNRYAPGIKKEIVATGSKLFISGHSHILKVIYDQSINCLHINPGAAGKQGWHQVRTIVRFVIDGKDIRECEVIELGKRSS